MDSVLTPAGSLAENNDTDTRNHDTAQQRPAVLTSAAQGGSLIHHELQARVLAFIQPAFTMASYSAAMNLGLSFRFRSKSNFKAGIGLSRRGAGYSQPGAERRS